MPLILIHPGEESETVSLLDVLRERHDARRKAILDEMEKRKQGGIPLDDDTRWLEVDEAVKKLGEEVGRRASDEAAKTALGIVRATDGNAIVDTGEYVPPDDLDLADIKVRFRVVSDSKKKAWGSRALSAARDYRDALAASDTAGMNHADARLVDVYAECVCDVLVALDGVDGLKPDMRDNVEALRLCGLFVLLYQACDYFLELPPGKALRCGAPHQST